MYLFYTLMCRNYQEYKWKPCWSQIETFQKSVPELFFKMVTLRVEYCVKRKTLKVQSCREFHCKRSGHKIRLIPSPDGQVRPDLVRHKMRRRESERLYKERNPSSWGTPPPTNLHPPEPRFRLSHGSHLHGGGLLPWRKGAKRRRSPMTPAAGESPALPPVPPPAPLAAHLCHLHRYLHHQLLLLCSGSSSHTPLYHPI
jgi:hypothetical protein